MNIIYYLVLLVNVLIVSVIDIKTKKIHNLWTLLHLFIYFILIIFSMNNVTFSIGHLFLPITIFVTGFVLFLVKIVAAGDVKYLSSFFLLLPESEQDVTFNFLLITTAVFGVFVLLLNILKNWQKIYIAILHSDGKTIKEVFGTKVPFAPLIGLSWILYGIQFFRLFS
jgi:prepilin peptidase CpaA